MQGGRPADQWRETLVNADAPIAEAIRILDANAKQICLVIDAEGRLIGSLTDGDVRRGILRSVSLNAPVRDVMNATPKLARMGSSIAETKALMARFSVRQIPIVDDRGYVTGIHYFDDLFHRAASDDTLVVLMAGGEGQRLRPLTDDTPKPLLKVAGRPILQSILESFIEQDFFRFVISVNYRGELVHEHFGDGSDWNVEITYLRETEPMGTAGALTLLPQPPQSTFIVMNGDLLTTINFGSLLEFHREQNGIATMAVRDYAYQIPFGVAELDKYRLRAIREKPVHRCLVNAGIYAFEPEVLNVLDDAQKIDMPQLFDRITANGRTAAAYPIREYWVDIGRKEDLAKAEAEFNDHFC